ncbi:RNA polymerase III subunit H isoform 2-T5 [Glossina fuscipes fuscipes]
MFVLAELKDTVRISPDQFNLKLLEAVRDEINRKLANKVLLNVGLCIALKDVVSLKDSFILPGDGASHTEVVFRYIVFRPPVGNVLTALQHPSRFDETERAWVWEYPLDDGGKHDLFMDIGEPIKFRVSREIFEESSPIGPPKNETLQPGASAQGCTSAAQQTNEARTPYKIIAAINESGLGVLSWWDQQQQAEETNNEEEAEENNVDYDNDENGEGAYEE